MARELPPQTPGPAHTDQSVDHGDWMTPLHLHRDAAVFYGMALKYDAMNKVGSVEATERFVRASVLAAVSGLEAQLNMTSFSYAEAHKEALTPLVRDVLLEMETVIDEQGRIHRRKRRIGLTTRLCFLTAFLSGKEFPRGGQLWQELLAVIELRDSIAHPKPPFPWGWRPEQARTALDTVSAVLTEVSRLMGADPPSWCIPADELAAYYGDRLI